MPCLLAKHARCCLPERLAFLADSLGWERFHYVGHSWGATIGCHLSAAFPERLCSLALLDAGYLPAPPEWSDPEAMLQRARALTSEFRFTSWEAMGDRRPPRWSAWSSTALAAGMRRGADGAIVPGLAPEVYAAVTGGVAAEPPSSALELVRQGGVPTFLIRATEPSDDEPDSDCASSTLRCAVVAWSPGLLPRPRRRPRNIARATPRRMAQ